LEEDVVSTRAAATAALLVARQVAVMAVEDGASEAATARELGVTRMTVRDWLGKR
jgi:transposase